MSNTIQPYSYQPPAQASDATPTGANSVTQGQLQAKPGAQTDSVTLSAAAQTNAALVGSARKADGVDQSHVNAIKAALANGTYNVSPEDLAGAISAVLRETRE